MNLAALPGVRYSLENPHAYVESDVTGFLNILKGCRHHGCEHLIYASSSSAYGSNTRKPFRTTDNVDHPISLYVATKKSNERMAHTYAHLFGLPATGLRFFTVYGPWGRPDMAVYLFTKAIFREHTDPSLRPWQGPARFHLRRPCRGKHCPPHGASVATRCGLVWRFAQSIDEHRPPWRVHNIGNHQPVVVTELVRILEEKIGRTAIIELAPLLPGDAAATYADVTSLTEAVDFCSATPLDVGIEMLVERYRGFHGV